MHTACRTGAWLLAACEAPDPGHLQGAGQSPGSGAHLWRGSADRAARAQSPGAAPTRAQRHVAPAASRRCARRDELWSFVGKKDTKRWLWIALCRRTRQIVAFVLGDRRDATCRRLWHKIPASYRSCHSYSDFWAAYQQVFSSATHQSVGKESGQTAHVERWNNTLRQRLARFVRKTLSFSKSDVNHHIVTKWFIAEYDLGISLTM